MELSQITQKKIIILHLFFLLTYLYKLMYINVIKWSKCLDYL